MGKSVLKPKSRRGGPRPGSGRPPAPPSEERDAIRRAREAGRSALPELVEIQLRIARDESADLSARQRAIEFIANRVGMPAEQKVTSEGEGASILALVAALGSPLPDDPS